MQTSLLKRVPGADGAESSAQVVEAIEDLEAIAQSAGLRYVDDSAPGITRLRRGASFTYRLPDGATVRDKKTLERIKALAIPPAWTDVWICPIEQGHIQATGRDARGRKQYRYHARWRQTRDENKFARMLEFGQALVTIRSQVKADMAQPGLPHSKVVATVVWLLDHTFIRVGNDQYARENKSFGLTTLRNRHVKVEGSQVQFSFRGKSGVRHKLAVSNPRVARIIKLSQELPGQELFQYEAAPGEYRPVDSTDVNNYLHEVTGTRFTAKDFRTWGGTVMALRALRQLEPYETKTQAKANLVQAIKQVAGTLGNTPAVCRSCYVHPAVIDAYLDGTIQEQIEGSEPDERAIDDGSELQEHLSEDEQAVVRFLTAAVSAAGG